MLKQLVFVVMTIVSVRCAEETPEQKAAREQQQASRAAEVARSRQHAEAMKKWYAENPEPTTGTSERYLDSRTGAALERTVKRVISMAGYRCDRVRTVERIAADELARVGAQDGRLVDCNEDGIYLVLESADGFRAVKR